MLGRIGAALAAALTLMMLAAPAAPAAWTQPFPGAFNADPAKEAGDPFLLAAGGTLWTAWEEGSFSSRQVQVAKLTANGWQRVGAPVGTAGSTDPVLAEHGGSIYVAYQTSRMLADRSSQSDVHVARFDGTSWQAVGGPVDRSLDKDAGSPDLTVFGGALHIAWYENRTELDFNPTLLAPQQVDRSSIRVAKLSGSTWQDVGGPVSFTAQDDDPSDVDNSIEPSIAGAGARLWLAWREEASVRAAYTDNTTWNHLAEPVSSPGASSADYPDLHAIGRTPWLAWSEFDTQSRVRVARINGDQTRFVQPVGGPSPIQRNAKENASAPSLGSAAGRPVVAWHELEDQGRTAEILVARLNASHSDWEELAPAADGSPINHDSNAGAQFPALAVLDDIPAVSWIEASSASGSIRRGVYSARLEPDYLGDPEAVATDDGAMFLARLRTFELPYPAGFAWGRSPREFFTPTTRTSGPEDTIVAAANGLEPQTQYFLQAFADLGEPDSFGPATTFTTDAPAGEPGPAGPTGPTGPQGPTGGTGSQGPTGESGPQGPTGETGSQGPSGPSGPQGPGGETGATGPQGPPGETGETGETGEQGPAGDPGPQGPAGDTGPQGSPGASGADGVAGRAGADGRDGASPFLIAILDARNRIASRRGLRIRYVSTMSAAVQLEVIRGERRVARVARTARLGRNAIRWNGRIGKRRADAGRYTLRLTAVAADGRRTIDSMRVRVRPRR